MSSKSQNRHIKAGAIAKNASGDEFQTAVYSSPIPAAADFREYGCVLPSAPDRILAMAEKEQAEAFAEAEHERQMERRSVPMRWVGLIFSFALIAGGLAGGIVLVLHDKNITGIVTLGTAFLSTVAIMTGNSARKQS